MASIDLTSNFSVGAFESVVASALDGGSKDKKEAERVLLKFKEHPDALLKVDAIMREAQRKESQFIGMQILEENIKTRWRLLTEEARGSIRKYVFNGMVREAMRGGDEKIVLLKMNGVLVEIAKKDWPLRWPSFVEDLIGVAKSTSMGVASNVFLVLRDLNEEVFTERKELTTAQRRRLQGALGKEYGRIFEFILTILEFAETQEVDEELLNNCLYVFRSYACRFPEDFIYETNVIEKILGHLNSPHTIAALDCMEAVGGLRPSKMSQRPIIQVHTGLTEFFRLYMKKFEATTLHGSYSRLKEKEVDFLKHYAMAFASLYGNRLEELGSGRGVQGFQYLVELTRVDDRSLFDILFETWGKLIKVLYDEYPLRLKTSRPLQRDIFLDVLRSLFPLLVRNMPRPDEVFIRTNDIGEVIKDRKIETSEVEFYKKMRNNLHFLSFVIGEHMKNYLENSLSKFIGPEGWSSQIETFNKLCWVVGALGGAFDEADERSFFISIIKTLLSICEVRVLKSEKAIVASNIMFIIGQYHRFLKYNTEFLSVVVRKLFEFMHEDYEGIKEMACDNLMRICEAAPTHFYASVDGSLIFDSACLSLHSAINVLEPALQRQLLESLLTVVRDGPRSSDIHAVSRVYAGVGVVDYLGKGDYIRDLGANLKKIVHHVESYSIGLRMLPSLVIRLIDLDALFALLSTASLSPPTKSSEILLKSLGNFFVAAVSANSENFVERLQRILIECFNGQAPLIDVAAAILRLSSCEDPTSAMRLRSILSAILFPSSGYLQDADKSPESAIAVLNLFTSAIESSFVVALPFILESSSKDTLFNALLASFTSLWEVSSLSLKLLLLIVDQSYQHGFVQFFDSFYFLILENLLGLVFDKDMRKTYDIQVDLLYRILFYLRPVAGPHGVKYPIPSINPQIVREFVRRLFVTNFHNVTERSLDLFLTGLFDIVETEAFRAHLDDFRLKIGEYGDDSDALDEEAVLKERLARR